MKMHKIATPDQTNHSEVQGQTTEKLHIGTKPVNSHEHILSMQRTSGNAAARRTIELSQPRSATVVSTPTVQRDEDDALTVPMTIEELQTEDVIRRTPAPQQDDSSLLRMWPVNTGVTFVGEAGVTPGIPLYFSGGVLVEIKRTSQEMMTILIRKLGTVAGDTGVGASAGVYNKRTKEGIGAQAGVNAQAGVKGLESVKYQIPFAEFSTFLLQYAKDAALKQIGVDVGLANYLLKRLGYQTLEKYEIERKTELSAFIQGDASASIGAQNHAEGREGKGDYGDWEYDSAKVARNGDRPSLGEATILQRLLATWRASLKIGGEIKGGYTVKPLPKNNAGQDQKEYTFTLEGNKIGELSLPIVDLSSLPLGSGGAGVNVMVSVATDANGAETIQKVDAEFYTKAGELDVFAGPGSQNTLRLKNLSVKTFEELFALLTPKGGAANPKAVREMASNAEIAIRQRYDFLKPPGHVFKSFMENRSGVRVLNTDNKGKFDRWGVSFGLYLTANYGLDGGHVFDLWELIKPEAQRLLQSASDGQSVAAVYKALTEFTTDFTKSPLYQKLEKIVFDNVFVDEAAFRLLLEGGIGAQIALSEGLKGRLDGFANLGGFYERDITGGSRMSLTEFLKAAADEYNAIMKLLEDLWAWLTSDKQGSSSDTAASGNGTGAGSKPPASVGKAGTGDGQKTTPAQPARSTIQDVEVVPRRANEKGVPSGSLTASYYYANRQLWARFSVTEMRDGKWYRYNASVPYQIRRKVGDTVYINLQGPTKITPEGAITGHTIMPWKLPVPLKIKLIKDYPAAAAK